MLTDSVGSILHNAYQGQLVFVAQCLMSQLGRLEHLGMT